MERIERTVFISYRRTNFSWALAIFQDLTQHGFDVFIDYTGINSGAFETVILENIKARAHFIVLLTPSALERCGEPGDWLRREIETALEVKRNIIPLMLENFDFGAPGMGSQLTGNLGALKQYNGLRVVPEYFSEGMERLREKYLSVPLDAVMLPSPSVAAQQAAKKEQAAAATAPAVPKIELGMAQSAPIPRLWKYFATRHLGWQLFALLIAGTLIALGAMLIVQYRQFGQSEKDKQEAAEDAQWANAVKVISQDSKLSTIALDRFFKSPRYGDSAKAYAAQILANSSDEVLFGELFRAAFTPATWSVLDPLLKLDRALRARQEPLDTKSYIAKTDTNDYAKLSDDEKKIDRYDSDAFRETCSQIAPVLRPQRSQVSTVFRFQRPSGEELDLSQTYIYNCDWSSVDLAGANLDEARILWVGLKGANLSGITRFSGIYIYHVAWWEAESISPELLDFLQNSSDSKYKQGAKYGPSYRTFSPEEYAAAVNRLKTQKQ